MGLSPVPLYSLCSCFSGHPSSPPGARGQTWSPPRPLWPGRPNHLCSQTQKLWNMRKCELADTGHWAECDTGGSVHSARGYSRQAARQTDALIFSHFIVTDILNHKPDSVFSLLVSEYIPASGAGCSPQAAVRAKVVQHPPGGSSAQCLAVTRAGIRPPC